MKSFSQFNGAELEVLRAFGEQTTIAYPADCQSSSEEIAQALVSLKNKGLVHGKAPYKLTKKGRQIVSLLGSDSVS